MNVSAPPILWDVYEEHLEEAAFLWGFWENALVGANYTPVQVVEGPEERLRAHLDALVLGGVRVAERLLLPALADEDPGKVFAAAWSLLHTEDRDQFSAVAAMLTSAAPPARPGLARAFELAERGDLAERMPSLWDGGSDFARKVVVDTLASRDLVWTAEHLPENLASSDAGVLAAALRAARSTPDHTVQFEVERAWAHPDPRVRGEAIATGFLLGMRGVWDACHREAEAGGPSAWFPLALLALPQSSRSTSLFDVFLNKPETRRPAIWALGFLGTIEAADYLITQLSDDDVARLAGEAFSAITGIAMTGNFLRPDPAPASESDGVQPDDSLPEVLPEAHLSLPNPVTVAGWWRGAQAQFGTATSYLYGRPRAGAALRFALSEGSMWRRHVIALELAASSRPSVALQTRSWARDYRDA